MPTFLDTLKKGLKSNGFLDQIRNRMNQKPETKVKPPNIGMPLDEFHKQIEELKDESLPKIFSAIDKHPEIKDKKLARQKAIEFIGENL